MSGTDLGRAFSSPSSALGMIEETLLQSQSLLRQSTERILEYPKKAFIGHVGTTELAAYAFIQILAVRFVNGILIGMSSATETLCGQAFGFTLAAFKDLWPVMKMSASSGIMQCLELWYTAILVLVASYMPNASVVVSAFSICVNIVAFVFMICLGFQASVSVRVSNELGEGNAKAAMYSAQPVYCGVAIGCGRQTMAAWVNFVSLYIIGIPVGVVLAYVALWEVKGMLIGLLIGLLTQTVILAILVWKTNWEEQVEKAQERVNRWFIRVPGDGDEDDEDNPMKSI
ncbi:hypothetical protein MLD38_007648 [Melastoma candidum]|nr:hypothetical protein MLD38_007648 [Melastoma candidum]